MNLLEPVFCLTKNYNVTRTAVHNQLKETEEKLEHYENVLKIKYRNQEIINVIKNI